MTEEGEMEYELVDYVTSDRRGFGLHNQRCENTGFCLIYFIVV
jgi:hypothetical protein